MKQQKSKSSKSPSGHVKLYKSSDHVIGPIFCCLRRQLVIASRPHSLGGSASNTFAYVVPYY